MPKLKKLLGDSWEQGRDNMRWSEDMDQALLNAFVEESIDLNDAFEDMRMHDIEVHSVEENPFSPLTFETFSPSYVQSYQSTGTSGSRSSKRKAHMADISDPQYERITMGINVLAEAIREGNCISDRLHMVAEKQIKLAERQVDVAERHIAVAEKQIEIAEKGLSIIEQSRPRVYTESDVWKLLTELGVIERYKMRCYRYLCANELKKREIFGVPHEMRLQALIEMMHEAGIQ
ncbi:hypothetical protein SESBI_25937 [Sesbania bispinosa]|nr:hypothetical protein SESBI_25937 [Sesbania bispinosa]